MRLLILLSPLLFITACSHSPLHTGVIAEENRYNMANLQVGMSDMQVAQIMGRPYKMETIETENNGIFEVWYYIIKPSGMGERNVLPRNLTPLLFQDHILKGWGKEYYLYATENEEYLQRREYYKGEQYEEDAEDWPADEHRMIPEKKETQPSEPKKESPPPEKNEYKKPQPSKEKNKDYYWWQ